MLACWLLACPTDVDAPDGFNGLNGLHTPVGLDAPDGLDTPVSLDGLDAPPGLDGITLYVSPSDLNGDPAQAGKTGRPIGQPNTLINVCHQEVRVLFCL